MEIPALCTFIDSARRQALARGYSDSLHVGNVEVWAVRLPPSLRAQLRRLNSAPAVAWRINGEPITEMQLRAWLASPVM